MLSVALIAAGAGLLAYGLLYNAIAVTSNAPSPGPPVIPGLDDPVLPPVPPPLPVVASTALLSEPAVTQEVARGGVARNEFGQLTKTYEGNQAPKACPT